MPDFHYERLHEGYTVGLDEAGCGPWAGPVIAAAALLIYEKFPANLLKQIDDSKKLTSLKREQLYGEIQNLEGEACYTAIGSCSVEEIDRHNIRKAATWAMERAADALKLPFNIKPTFGLADGTVKPNLLYPVQSLIKGDQLSLSIAAASIVAKVTRDRLMKELSLHYPRYGWEKNAGYGTALHQAALADHGITPHHRLSFAPIRRIQEKMRKSDLCLFERVNTHL